MSDLTGGTPVYGIIAAILIGSAILFAMRLALGADVLLQLLELAR